MWLYINNRYFVANCVGFIFKMILASLFVFVWVFVKFSTHIM